ncbi:MAG TPA: glycoside hydrolase family 3 N-terminal domain-containing protein, partial [Elusimicrobiales bacterium]|nr:glycoside hydrolase family 3 N-terminal domain-containing protein [Elusimicrobiales bacterium]
GRAGSGPSTEEKAAQVLMISIDAAEIARATAPAAMGLGGIQLQWGSYSLEDTRRLTDELQRTAASGVTRTPLFIAADYEGGSVYVPTTLGLAELPTNMMLGAADDQNNTASLFYLAGRELKRAGINMVLGPVLDVNTNAGNPIIGVRAFGNDAGLVSRVGAAVINGFRTAGVLPTAKHFPGHGAAGQDSHKTLPVVNSAASELEAVHLAPFRKAVELKVPVIMTAHIVYPAIDPSAPATLSRRVIGGLLKEKLGYGGLVMTDSLDMKAVTSRFPIHKAAALALKAGADLILIGKGDFLRARDEISRQVKAGTLEASRLDDAYARVLEAKRAAGLFDAAEYPSPFDKAYVKIAEALSDEAVTLVSDRDALVPLEDKSVKTAVILFAPPRFSGNALALYRALAERGYNVEQSVFGIDPDGPDTARALAIAAGADRLVIGSFQWAQAQNRGQRKAIRALLATGKPSVVISLMSPYDLSAYPEAGAALAVYGMTEPGMAAAGKALAGEFPPRGRLPVGPGTVK